MSLGPSWVLVGNRVITQGDEDALSPIERPAFERVVLKVRRQSGAARIVARNLLRNFGVSDVHLPRQPPGGVTWPSGIVGSLAHDGQIAVAAVATAEHVLGIGIDVEPDEPLSSDLVKIIATPAECARYTRAMLERRILFCCKEAVYKALNPIDGIFLDFQDIEIDLDGSRGGAWVRNQQRATLSLIEAPRIVALAYVSAT